jgi:hypothetical protein
VAAGRVGGDVVGGRSCPMNTRSTKSLRRHSVVAKHLGERAERSDERGRAHENGIGVGRSPAAAARGRFRLRATQAARHRLKCAREGPAARFQALAAARASGSWIASSAGWPSRLIAPGATPITRLNARAKAASER